MMDEHIGPLVGLLAAFVSLGFLVAYGGLRERHRADLAMVVGVLAWMVDVYWHDHISQADFNLIDAFIDHFNFQFCLAAGTGLVLLAVNGYHLRIAMVWKIEAVGGSLLLAAWATTLHDGWLLAWRVLTIVVGIIVCVLLVSWRVNQRDQQAWTVFALSLVLMLCGVGGVLWHDQFATWASIGFYMYPPVLLSLWWVVSGRFGNLRVPDPVTEVPVEVEERERIAQEVHDGVGSHLTSILASMDPLDPKQNALMLSLEQCLLDLRMMVDRLHEGVGISLPHSLATLRYRLKGGMDRNETRLIWRVEDHPAMAQLPPASAVHCLRVAQESLANALRHARATEVQLRCAYREPGHVVELEISDNGVGMDLAEVNALSGGKGLRGMQRRAAEMGASLDVFSKPGRGVRIRLVIPCGLSSSLHPGMGGAPAEDPEGRLQALNSEADPDHR
jgi:signal transduction histidine kinase